MTDQIESTKLFSICLASESNQVHEWKHIAWVIRLRVESKRYPSNYRSVILQPKQFSYFNPWTSGKQSALRKDSANPVLTEEQVISEALKGYAGDIYSKWTDELRSCVMGVTSARLWECPFPLDTLHYYSPVSMRPRGSKPPWAASARLLITPSGVDSDRFIFAAGVK